MRKNVFGRQFSRDTNERKALFKSLISSLILDESIKTTLEKAKAIKGDVDKIINKTKRGDEKLAVQLLQRSLGTDAMNKVIKDLAPRFIDRNSGYTRIIRLGRRFSDNAEMALMEWVVKPKIKDQKLPARNASQRNAGGNIKNDVKELSSGEIKKKPQAKKAAVKTKSDLVKTGKEEARKKVAKK